VRREATALLAHGSLTRLEHGILWLRVRRGSSISGEERGPVGCLRVLSIMWAHQLAVGEILISISIINIGRRRVEICLLHDLSLVLVAHILHLVFVGEEDGRHTIPVVLLLSHVAKRRCCFSVDLLASAVVYEALGCQAEARVDRLVNARLINTVIVVQSRCALFAHAEGHIAVLLQIHLVG